MRASSLSCLAGCLLIACATSEAPEPHAQLELRSTGEPQPDSDQLPTYQLSFGDVSIAEVLAAVHDPATSTLVWIDPAGTLWAAPSATAPDDARAIARDVLPGLALSRGRLAFAARVDGPETAPYLADLGTNQVIALDDGPGPDEVLGFSPGGDEVLLLSGRTGLASLFAVGVDRPSVRQLTNVGLRPGPGLDRSRVTPAPMRARDVVWTAREIEYQAGEWAVHIAVTEVAR